MTDQEMRIAIAEACGWRYVTSRSAFNYLMHPKWNDVDRVGICCGKHLSANEAFQALTQPNDTGIIIPDYPTDLNAMHEVLIDHICGDKDKEVQFLKELNAIIDLIADSEDVPVVCEWNMALIVAQCDWLAEAFLKTIGKWKG